MPRGVFRELLAEFFGTFILIVFGVGVVAQTVLSKGAAGTMLSINIAWGLAVTVFFYTNHLGVFGLGYDDLSTALRGEDDRHAGWLTPVA